MPKFLASVTDLAEARLAATAGADIIDLKDPASGALGALPHARIVDVVKGLGPGHTSSATVGDLPNDPGRVVAAVQTTAATGVDFVKVGLFADAGARDVVAALRTPAAHGVAIVVVLFADRAPDMDLIDSCMDAGCAGVMLDTADKSNGHLLAHMDPGALGDFVERTRRAGGLCGLAGSLRLCDIPALAGLGPDYLGFRGALCQQANRRAGVQLDAIKAVREMLTANTTISAPIASTAGAA